MDHIRLIASDMDATLLDERSQLPPDFAETIRALAGQGILFAAASGRPLYTLETMFPELLEEIILIGDNGGAARWKGKDLFVSEMPAEGWRQLARSTKQAGEQVRETSSDKSIVFPSYTHFIYTNRSE